jgi:hypothetical protein
VTLLLIAGVWLHVPGLNGPRYWQWMWIARPNALAIALAFTLAAAPALLALFVRRRVIAITLVAISVMALQFAAASLTGVSAQRRVTLLISDPANTSYYTAATQVLELKQRRPDIDVFRHFDRFVGFFPLHARTKPLVPVMLYVGLARIFGPATPIAAATLIALLTAASIVALFATVRRLADEETALIAAVIFALMPSLALFFPQLDLVYPLFTCGVLATWPRALQGSRGAAVAFGLVVFAMSLTSYSLLVIGVFCVLLALFRRSLRDVAMASAIAGITILAAYGLFVLATGYPAMATFRAALDQQRRILPLLHRPFPQTIPWDVLDFALGTGWAPLFAAVLFLARRERSELRPLVIAGLLTAPIVMITGLMQSETSRVFVFLMPFVALAAALELAHWQPRARLLVAATMVLVTVSLYANMRFMWELPPRPFRPIPSGAFR